MKLFYFSVLLLVILTQLSFVSAAPFSYVIDNFATSAEPVFRVLLGDVTGTPEFTAGEVLFAKFLVLVLLIAIINSIIKTMPFGSEKKISFLISLVVSLLAVRYITQGDFLSLVWLPYGVLGVLISSLLPFAIGFFYLESFKSSIIRRIGWSIYFVIFLALAYLRWDDFSSNAGFNLAWLYLAIAAVALVMWFMDRQVYSAIEIGKIESMHDINKKIRAIDVQKDIEELQNRLADSSTNADQRALLKDRIKERKKALKELLRS